MGIEIFNAQAVSANGQGQIIIYAPKGVMTKAEALNLAAWLVALADDHDEFRLVLEAVRNT